MISVHASPASNLFSSGGPGYSCSLLFYTHFRISPAGSLKSQREFWLEFYESIDHSGGAYIFKILNFPSHRHKFPFIWVILVVSNMPLNIASARFSFWDSNRHMFNLLSYCSLWFLTFISFHIFYLFYAFWIISLDMHCSLMIFFSVAFIYY